MTLRIAVTAGLLLLPTGGLVQAQTATSVYSAPDPYRDQRVLPSADATDAQAREALLRARGEAYHRAPDSAQTEEELRVTRALNAETAAQSALADKADEAARLDYQAALARHQIEAQQSQERARAAAQAVRAAQDQYDRDYAAWLESVRLCRSGVRAACAAPATRAP
jgi:hypothetical protein